MTERTRLACVSTAAILTLAVLVYFMARTPPDDSSGIAPAAPAGADGQRGPAALVSAGAHPAAGRSSPVADDAPDDISDGGLPAANSVLRVILEGITAEDAALASVSVTGVEEGRTWPPPQVRHSWPVRALTCEFDLDPLLARVTEQFAVLRDDELVVEVDHPQRFSERIQVPLSSGVERASGGVLYELRVRMAEVAFWPEFTLAVRDANTRAHLEDVELRGVPTAFMDRWRQPGTSPIFTTLGEGLSSPIALLGGRKANESEALVAGIAVAPAAGDAPRPAELIQPEENARGVVVYARAPGYAWGQIVLDVSKDAGRELLLVPATVLSVRFANVQRERYAALEKDATLCVKRVGPDGGEVDVWYQRLDATLESEGVRLEALEPGDYAVSVELGRAITWRKRPVLAREELSQSVGTTRELVLVLADSPAPPVRADLGGVLSFPAFGGEEQVRLQLFADDYIYGDADHELALADMERVGGALPSWRFRLADLAAGIYQVRLMPFEKSWMIELPEDGLEDLELALPELAQVLVETVDARTGERVPLEVIRYGSREELPGRVRHDWSGTRTTTRYEGEPGRFRFWTAPGAAYVHTYSVPSGVNIGIRRQDLELVPGLQSVQFELAPACTLRFEFRVDGAALPHDDGIFTGLSRGIRPVGHEGRARAVTYWILQASAPGIYEISFDGIGADRFLPIPARRVDVKAGETTEVIVDLQRK